MFCRYNMHSGHPTPSQDTRSSNRAPFHPTLKPLPSSDCLHNHTPPIGRPANRPAPWRRRREPHNQRNSATEESAATSRASLMSGFRSPLQWQVSPTPRERAASDRSASSGWRRSWSASASGTGSETGCGSAGGGGADCEIASASGAGAAAAAACGDASGAAASGAGTCGRRDAPGQTLTLEPRRERDERHGTSTIYCNRFNKIDNTIKQELFNWGSLDDIF